MPRKNPGHNCRNYQIFHSNEISFRTLDGEKHAISLIRQNKNLILKKKFNAFRLLGISMIYANEKIFKKAGFSEKEINQIQGVNK